MTHGSYRPDLAEWCSICRVIGWDGCCVHTLCFWCETSSADLHDNKAKRALMDPRQLERKRLLLKQKTEEMGREDPGSQTAPEGSPNTAGDDRPRNRVPRAGASA